MRTSITCAVLLALAEAASSFAPSLSTLPRAGIESTCTVRATKILSRPVRAAPLRLGGLQMAATTVPITVTGTNIELTEALKKKVNDKIGNALSKVSRKLTSCNVMLTVNKNPSVEKNQEIEVVMSVKGTTIRIKETSQDMYASIDSACDSVKRKLRKYKERIIDAHRAGRPEAADFDAGEIEGFEEFNASFGAGDPKPADMKVVKKKQFAMKPISTEDAVLCLEYLDHDFYVYKNKDNGGKVTVVYKRNSGGVGLIEPE